MSSYRILVVEDEMIVAELLQSVLSQASYEVISICASAEEALRVIEEEAPDLILLDISIQGDLNGIWLGQHIHKSFNIPFIYLTSYSDVETVKRAAQTIPMGYLIKPFDGAAVIAAVETAMARFKNSTPVKLTKKTSPGFFINNDSLFVKDEFRYNRISLESICYIKSDRNYIELYFDSKKTVLKTSLKSLLEILPDFFRQVHRSFVINLKKVDSVDNKNVRMGSHIVPLAKGNMGELINLLKSI